MTIKIMMPKKNKKYEKRKAQQEEFENTEVSLILKVKEIYLIREVLHSIHHYGKRTEKLWDLQVKIAKPVDRLVQKKYETKKRAEAGK